MEVVQANSIREPIAPQGARQKSLRMQVYRGVELACHFWCVCGGVLLVIALCIILTSIVGRFLSGLGIGPGSLIGDNELMEVACVIAAFAFLPWCQLKRGHVAVDILVARLGKRAGLLAAVISDVGMLVVAALIAWRLFINLLEKHAYGETSMQLYIPLSWIYALSFIGCVLFVMACFVTLLDNFNALTTRPTKT